ncbi:uncharacterized protein LOC110442034 [Mizuhopecten yessoensis]|uniref:Uncharacterized protein n=1 Tax=Mizuhopecten yessoensis TaxID=6573 RepID=A0A210PI59_MIZYE|nr:uncharacterized protein LOC110442034 [Mizuhopecten yessoensis]OWF36157.1 hypothetical protein KP79_PYT24190 [Mizuhopecten yessoensis]
MESSHENIEMSDSRTYGRNRHSGSVSRSSFLLIGANILLSCVILVLIILVFSGQKSSNEPVAESQISMSTLGESDRAVLERFPGYFRTSEEQETLEKSIRRNIPVNITIDSAICTIGVENPRSTPWCVLTPAVEDFHSCCVSNIQYSSPLFKVDNRGVDRKLAVFGNQRQFFRTETCAQVTGCELCTCEVEQVLYTGVYDTEQVGSDKRYGVAWFLFDGCCKCYNRG